jgi:hypothetical protein
MFFPQINHKIGFVRYSIATHADIYTFLPDGGCFIAVQNAELALGMQNLRNGQSMVYESIVAAIWPLAP